MTEWASVLLVFWALWLVDGLKLPPAERFGIAGRGRRARLSYGRWLLPGWWPAGWRTTAADLPFSVSPAGICNRPVGSAGRPAEAPARSTAWAWEDIRETDLKGGWILINGVRFCRATGHLTAGNILGLARLGEAARAARIEWWIYRWLRPAHLRRRARVLEHRTATAAMCNTAFLGLALAISGYLLTNAASRIPAAWAELLARALPLLGGYLLLLHLIAMVTAWRAARRLKAAGEDKRTAALFSAAMLPPQALRLRGLVGEPWFPPQHPLAYALAFARKRELVQLAFQALGDLRWPIGDSGDAPLAREIGRWHRTALAERLIPLLNAAGIAEQELFQAPMADGRASCRYCPRCGSQFTTEAARCPHGVALKPVSDLKR
jgi:hypothetical protein